MDLWNVQKTEFPKSVELDTLAALQSEPEHLVEMLKDWSVVASEAYPAELITHLRMNERRYLITKHRADVAMFVAQCLLENPNGVFYRLGSEIGFRFGKEGCEYKTCHCRFA